MSAFEKITNNVSFERIKMESERFRDLLSRIKVLCNFLQQEVSSDETSSAEEFDVLVEQLQAEIDTEKLQTEVSSGRLAEVELYLRKCVKSSRVELSEQTKTLDTLAHSADTEKKKVMALREIIGAVDVKTDEVGSGGDIIYNGLNLGPVDSADCQKPTDLWRRVSALVNSETMADCLERY